MHGLFNLVVLKFSICKLLPELCPRILYGAFMWVLLEKPALRDAYVRGKINEELDAVLDESNATFDRFAERYIVVFN